MNPSTTPTSAPKRNRAETTVFQSGNGQAVRIPKEFQFSTKHVEIRREGRSLVLRPVATTAAEALAELPPLSEEEAFDLDQAMDALNDLPPLDEPIHSEHPLPRRGQRR